MTEIALCHFRRRCYSRRRHFRRRRKAKHEKTRLSTFRSRRRRRPPRPSLTLYILANLLPPQKIYTYVCVRVHTYTHLHLHIYAYICIYSHQLISKPRIDMIAPHCLYAMPKSYDTDHLQVITKTYPSSANTLELRRRNNLEARTVIKDRTSVD